MPTLSPNDMRLTERSETLEQALFERASEQARGVKTNCGSGELPGIKASVAVTVTTGGPLTKKHVWAYQASR